MYELPNTATYQDITFGKFLFILPCTIPKIYSQITPNATTEKPRKPYGSGVSYVWTHVPFGTLYIISYSYSITVATRPDPTVRPPSRL